MNAVFQLATVESPKRIHVSTLSRQTLEDAGASHLGSEGFFIFEISDRVGTAGISVLGKAASFEAAMRFADLLGPTVEFSDY